MEGMQHQLPVPGWRDEEGCDRYFDGEPLWTDEESCIRYFQEASKKYTINNLKVDKFAEYEKAIRNFNEWGNKTPIRNNGELDGDDYMEKELGITMWLGEFGTESPTRNYRAWQDPEDMEERYEKMFAPMKEEKEEEWRKFRSQPNYVYEHCNVLQPGSREYMESMRAIIWYQDQERKKRREIRERRRERRVRRERTRRMMKMIKNWKFFYKSFYLLKKKITKSQYNRWLIT